MSKYSKRNAVSEQTKADAINMARGNQKPGQTKEQTKLIAQGIQKGIEQYKRKNKEKVREQDKKLKKSMVSSPLSDSSIINASKPGNVRWRKLPWVLLILSWLIFVVYILFII